VSDADNPVQGRHVDDVLITHELARRPSRAPAYEAESRALGLLAQEMANNPSGVLRKCAELVMELCHADSAGVSILEPGDTGSIFRWHMAVGAFAPNVGGTMPRDASPCGTVVDRNSVLLFNKAERFFPNLRGVEPRIYENLLAPWHVSGEAVGTLWAIKHTPEGRFDGEDARLLQNLSRVASAAYQMITALTQAKAAGAVLATLDLAAIMTRNLNDTIHFWSAGCERLYGWTAAEAVGRSAHDLLCTVFPVPRSEVEAALEHCGVWSGDLRQRTRDGREVVVAVRKVLHRDAEGRPVAVLESLADVTEARRAEQALRASEARLKELQAELLHVSRLSAAGEMASALAHELNQPLAAITTYISAGQLILTSDQGALAPERVVEIKRVIDRAAQQALRAGEIVRRLREFVAKGKAEKRPEDLRKLIEEASMLAVVGMRKDDIHTTFRLDPVLPPVLVDRVQIQQVLVNLIRNAVEAMAGENADDAPPHRELVVAAAPCDPEMVEISVADTGPGLAPEVADSLFEPFVSTKPNGMGVGLSICRTIVEMHDGRLWAELNGEAGTVFRFTVPRARADVSEGDHT
jgi:PAS domain S-box-containing protein